MADSPSTVTDREWVWASNLEKEAYCDAHGVLKPQETGPEHLPDARHEKVAELDREALELPAFTLTGKWMLFEPSSQIDVTWEEISDLVSDGTLYKAKASTKQSYDNNSDGNHVVIVYTPNYFDTDDVFRVRSVLRNELGNAETLYYKPDIYTLKGIYSSTASDVGLPSATRYSE